MNCLNTTHSATLLLLIPIISALVVALLLLSSTPASAANHNNRPRTGPEKKISEHPNPELLADERTAGLGYVAPRYKRAMVKAINAEKNLYKCRYQNATQRILDLDCFFSAIRHFEYNATWYKQAAITARVGGFIQTAYSLWNSSLYTVLQARAFVGEKLPEGTLSPLLMLKMTHRAAPADAIELAKVWVEVLVAEGKLALAQEIVETFLLPEKWVDLTQSVGDDDGAASSSSSSSDQQHLHNKGVNRTWTGYLTPLEAGEVYRSLLSPMEAAASQSFMDKGADIVKKRAALKKKILLQQEKEDGENDSEKEEKTRNKKKKTAGPEGDIYAPRSASTPPTPLDNSAAGLSFTALLGEHMGMTAELLVRDTLQSTSLVKAHIRKRGRQEFERTQRKKCGRAFYARSGGVVKWMSAVRYVEDCVLRWPHLQDWMNRDNASELLVKTYPGFHSISHAETHMFASLGTAKLLTLILNLTGPPGGAIEDALRQTPLHYAAAAGHKETVAIIMGHGVSPTIYDVGRVQPLFHLCRNAHLRKLLREGSFQMPRGAPTDVNKICSYDKDLVNMLQETDKKPRVEDRHDEVDDSGGGWTRTVKRKEESEQKCDRRIEMRNINTVNENDFVARYASGSEPVILRSEFSTAQNFFTKKNFVKNRGDKDINARVRVEIVPEAEKHGSGMALNMTVTEFLDSIKRRDKEEEKEEKEKEQRDDTTTTSNNNNDEKKAQKRERKSFFGVADVTQEHPWGYHVWGKLVHERAARRVRKSVERFISAEARQKIAEEEREAEEEKKDNKNNKKTTESSKKNKKNKKKLPQKELLGEIFRPPFAPRNATDTISIKQSYFAAVKTASLHICETGATSNFVTSFVGRVHAVIHGEQEVMLIPPAFAVTTRNPISSSDFDGKTSKARDITEHQEDWSEVDAGSSDKGSRVLRKCVLLPGDVLWVPAFWAFAFKSLNGESVSVSGKVTWR